MGWKHEETKDLIWEAIEAIKDGRADDALVMLERAGRPKWHSSAEAAEKYAKGKAKAAAKAHAAFADAMIAEQA
jgi:hypothetical protein